ncbi:MAG TPA: GntR family transcriptional regulator [Candidatus Nesterenkonia stercoripullorum]|uniref:GntR family transcriptional regulator n=1 Tax=Candidatus Nesterenkonia stercoripullorum TaxID=2838701 RepID=A0A9D2A8H5_9MICC|nr:GntR family transcriptional regulator [Candidatus Nesterenkonia stercoripullorum]
MHRASLIPRAARGSAATSGAAAPRRGRPRIQETATDIVASVLVTAGPRVGSSEYSTRQIAQLTGLSQTVVSRAIHAIRSSGSIETPPAHPQRLDSPSRQEAPDETGALQVDAVRVAFPLIMITFGAAEHVTRGHQQRATQRRCAALMAGLHISGAVDWSPAGTPSPPDQARPLDAQLRAQHAFEGPLTVVWHPDHGTWDEFRRRTAALLDRCAPDVNSLPGSLLRQIARRAGRGLHGLSWSRHTESEKSTSGDIFDSNMDSSQPTPEAAQASVRQWLPRPGLSVTEQIAIALRQEITNSGFRPGDRLAPSALAGSLTLSASTVRAAMRRLSDDGLLIHSEGAFFIPAISGVDVIDLYAARLHTGIVLLRGCATQPRHRLLAARLALSAVETAARRGTRSDVGHADLQFQHELADGSGLVQSARSFHALTLRLRMFISILQLDYSPAIDRILSDDRQILAAVLDGRTEDAVRIFRAKLDHAVRHMCAVAPDTFDARLWERLIR